MLGVHVSTGRNCLNIHISEMVWERLWFCQVVLGKTVVEHVLDKSEMWFLKTVINILTNTCFWHKIACT